jgi:hypothetical protein
VSRRISRIIGAVLPATAILSTLAWRWGAEAEAKVVSFAVSNPVCTAVDLTRNQCAINLRSLSITDDGTTPPYLTWTQILIDGHVRLRLVTFFEKSISYNSAMVPHGLEVPCGLPDEAGLGDEIGKQYPVNLEPLDQSGASMGNDIANVLCPAAVSTTSTSTTTTTSTLPPGPCDGIPSGPTLASTDCRTQELLASVQADGRLGAIQPKLVTALRRAISLMQDAQAKCAAGHRAPARRRVRQAAGKLKLVVHRLRSKTSRKKLPTDLREQLLGEGTGILTDTKALRRVLACPTA